MSDVTDADREKVVQIIKQAAIDEKWLPPQPYRLHVYRLAAALADERAKARAPFLRLASEFGSWPSARILSPHDAGDRIRQEAKETE